MTTPDAPRACKNTDREIWRDGDGEGYYTPDCASIFVTEDGGIGISVNGNVIVRPVREWHRALSQAGGEPRCPDCGCEFDDHQCPSVSVERERETQRLDICASCGQPFRSCKCFNAPDTPQSVLTCTCSKHPLWDGYDGDCPIHGWFEPAAPDTPQSVPADRTMVEVRELYGDDEEGRNRVVSLLAERDKLLAEVAHLKGEK
jgi:hypothetical protein